MRSHPYINSIRPASMQTQTSSVTKVFQSAQSIVKKSAESIPPSISSPSFTAISQDPKENRPPSPPQLVPQPTPSKPIPTTTISLNRNSSSNAILAQLKSIGPNFKSIFIRPKNAKPIGQFFDWILNFGEEIFSYFFLIKDPSTLLIKSNTSKKATNHDSTILPFFKNSSLAHLLPSIEPKEIRLDSSVDELLNKFAVESKPNLIHLKKIL